LLFVQPEIEALRPKLKEILYDCATEVKATKAALFLYNGTDKFELVAEYGFRSLIRQSANLNDALIDRCGRGRSAFFVNGLSVEPRFSELLYEAKSERLLAAPLYQRGQLVGVIDMRDKSGRQPFEVTDLSKAQAVADRIMEQFANKNVFRQRFITLASYADPTLTSGTAAIPASPRPAASRAAPSTTQSAPAQPAQRLSTEIPSIADVIIRARAATASLATAGAEVDRLTPADIAIARDLLRGIVRLPGLVVAAFTQSDPDGGVQEVVSRSPLNKDALTAFRSKLGTWMQKRGEPGTIGEPNVANLGGGQEIMASQLVKVVTAPLVVGNLRGLFLTAAYEEAPTRLAQEFLEWFLGTLQTSLEQSIVSSSMARLKRVVAEKLLEADFRRYPALRRHTEKVAELSERFAGVLGLGITDIETVVFASLLHDVGLRLLDYDHVYRGHDLGPDEIAIVREHPIVGAALVEPIFGLDVARTILAHHERMDGHGYPHQRSGADIPIPARVLQICDAFIAMTDEESYQPPKSTQQAMAEIEAAAGTQFDQNMARRFVEMMRGLSS
jgi:hypothetical protein